MPDDKTTESRPVEPIQVTVIGTGDGSKLPSGTVAVTPGAHQPDVVTVVVKPVMALAVRFINNYLTMLVGTITAGMGTNIIPFTDFMDLFRKACLLSLVPAVVALLKDLVTIFGRLEQKNPLLTGSI